MPESYPRLFEGASTGPPTVGQVVETFLALADRGKSDRSEAERTRILGVFCSEFGRNLAEKCIPLHLTQFLKSHTEWESDWTRMRVNRTIQRVFNWASDQGLIARNPFKSVRYRPGSRGRPMSLAERQAFLRNTDPCFRRVLIALWLSGARPGELRSLQWEFLDLERCCAVLRNHKTAHSRADGKPRIIVFHPAIIKLLVWIRRRKHHPQFVFTNSRGRPWTRSALDLRIYRMRKQLGIPADCKLYGTRHAFGTGAAVNGVELKTLSALMGHTTTKMTEHYIHLANEVDHLRDALLRATKRT